MRVTVFGASGGIGRELVTQAIGRGDEVTAVIRRSSAADLPAEAEIVRVDAFDDPAALVPALDGRDAVLSGIGPRGRNDGPVAAPITAVIVEAMKQAGVPRIVAVSAAPVGPPPEHDAFVNKRVLMPLIGSILKPVYDDLDQMEQVLRASGLDWTVVRPPKLTAKPATGAYRTVVGANIGRAFSVSRADVASAMLDALGDPATVGQPVGIAN